MDPHDRLGWQLHAAAVARLSGKSARIPDAGLIFWNLFAAMCAFRNGTEPLDWTEIEAYARLHRWPLEPRHIELLRTLDQAWLDQARAAAGSHRADAKSVPPAHAAPMTAAAFDAVFG